MQYVEIHIKGHLDEHWAEWLDGFVMMHNDPDETVLTGPVVDQAALYGLMAKLRDLGVRLKSINLSTASDRS